MSNMSNLIQTAKKHGIHVLSHEHGQFPVPNKYHDVLCLTSDFMLHVAKGETLNQHVREFIDRLQRQNIDVQDKNINEVSITFLREMYRHLINRTVTFILF